MIFQLKTSIFIEISHSMPNCGSINGNLGSHLAMSKCFEYVLLLRELDKILFQS